MATNSGHLYLAFKDALGLPEHVISFKITARMNAMVVVECEYRPNINTGDLTAVVKRFKLAEIPLLA